MDSSGTVAVKTFSRNKIQIIKELGSGTFGKVYKASIQDFKFPVAVKIFYPDFTGILPNLDSKLRENAFDELAKVAVLDHINIVRLLGMVEDKIPWLIFEYMKDGNLLEYVLRKKDAREKTLFKFCRDICHGMSFIHQNNFLHKDLAARNILLDGKSAKIADLGLCSFMSEEHHGAYALGGKLFPYRHAATECIVESIFTFESDVWSFGVLMFEIFTGGTVPYGKDNKQPEVRRFIADGLNPTNFYLPSCSDEVYFVMNSIFLVKREDRPSFVDLCDQFDTLVNGRNLNRNLTLRREMSPARPLHSSHNSINEISYQSASGPNFSNGFTKVKKSSDALQIPGNLNRANQFSSHPDIHYILQQSSPPTNLTTQSHRSRFQAVKEDGQSSLLSVSPPSNFYGERRYSEIPNIGISPVEIRDHLSVSKPPRRTASFNNISKPEGYKQSSGVDQSLLKDFVFNRFKKV